ncbi:MAG: LysR substrate-binding domain-containing protein, partial [Parvularcula sp.]|nr:LysR substrate-binding domain-containing protein [Parvularcula sp.]
RRGTPAHVADLQRFDLIGYERETPALRALLAGVPGLSRDVFALRADNQLAQLAAIRAGFGIGVCQVGIAARESRLVRVLADTFAPELPTWIVMHEDLRASPRCRAVFDALAGALA